MQSLILDGGVAVIKGAAATLLMVAAIMIT